MPWEKALNEGRENKIKNTLLKFNEVSAMTITIQATLSIKTEIKGQDLSSSSVIYPVCMGDKGPLADYTGDKLEAAIRLLSQTFGRVDFAIADMVRLSTVKMESPTLTDAQIARQ